jgi:hypothetical protein
MEVTVLPEFEFKGGKNGCLRMAYFADGSCVDARRYQKTGNAIIDITKGPYWDRDPRYSFNGLRPGNYVTSQAAESC